MRVACKLDVSRARRSYGRVYRGFLSSVGSLSSASSPSHQRAEMPFASKVRRVIQVGGARSVCDSKCPLWRKVHVGYALRHVGAVIHVVHAVPKVIPSRKDGRSCGATHCAACVHILKINGTGRLRPCREPRRNCRAIVRPTKVCPADVIAKHKQKRRHRCSSSGSARSV